MPDTTNAVSASLLGPSVMATLVCPYAAPVIDAYTKFLGLQVSDRGELSLSLAEGWGAPQLAGAGYYLLANVLGDSWLRIVEDPGCVIPEPLASTGWMALEISVQDVDALAASLHGSPFTVLRPPANLDLSDQIRATQVAGPAGEVLYLTEIKGPVPPFEIAAARCAVDRLFIPVLCCHSRHESLAFYEQLAGRQGIAFETRITVVNQAYGYDLAQRHPVATLQLGGNSLLEIDQIDAAKPPVSGGRALPGGAAMISFLTGDLSAAAVPVGSTSMAAQPQAPYVGGRSICLQGPAGEWLELIERTG